MIKGDYFLKLLKPLFSILLIGFFGLLGNSFVNAGITIPVGLVSFHSTVDSNYENTFLRGGAFITNYLGQGRGILALRNNVLVWWAKNGFPYFYLQANSHNNLQQGFPDRFYACDEITGEVATMPGNCTLGETWTFSGDTSDITNLFNGFFNTVVSDDYVYYDYVDYRYVGATWDYTQNFMHICWSSHSVGSSLCFKVGRDTGYGNGGNLINSQNLSDMTFARLQESWIGKAPGVNGYLGQFAGSTEGSSQGFLDSTITGDYVYADCTWKDILIALESEGYNRYVCYGGLDNFDLFDSSINYNPIAGQGLSITDIWAWSGSRAWDSFPEWFTFWNGLYKDTTDNNYTSIWESYPAVYRTYFQVYNAYKGSVLDPRTVLEYCQLRTLTGEQLNNTAGGYFKPVCETIIREKQTGLWNSRVDGTIYSGGVYTGDVPISVNWNGVGNMSGLETQGDGLVFIQNFFNLAKSKITTNYSDNFSGVLPGYIVVFLLAIILFRFLRH